MGQVNASYNREPEVELRNGQNGAAAVAAVQKQGSTAYGAAKGEEAEAGAGTETGAEASLEAEPEGDVPPFTRSLLRVYGKPLLISQLAMLGYGLLLYANPMLLWCAPLFELCFEGFYYLLFCYVQVRTKADWGTCPKAIGGGGAWGHLH